MMTANEEGESFERRARIHLHIQRALTRGGTMHAFMKELVAVHEREYPAHEWGAFRSVDDDEVEDLRRRQNRAKSGARGMLVGVVQRTPGDVAEDVYFADIPENAASLDFVEWPGRSSVELLGSRVVPRLSHACFDHERSPRMDGGTVVLGYVAKLVSLLLRTPDDVREFGTGDVLLGLHQTTPWFIGRTDAGGFIATPLSVCAARITAQRARYVAAIATAEGPPVAGRVTINTPSERPRVFRHPDGRRWEIELAADSLRLRFTDEDGDEFARSRTSSNPPWEAQALVRDQWLEGFVELEEPSG